MCLSRRSVLVTGLHDFDVVDQQQLDHVLDLLGSNSEKGLEGVLIPNELLANCPFSEHDGYNFVTKQTQERDAEEMIKQFREEWFPAAQRADETFPRVWPLPFDKFQDPSFWGLPQGVPHTHGSRGAPECQ